jgi:hypothetical protein
MFPESIARRRRGIAAGSSLRGGPAGWMWLACCLLAGCSSSGGERYTPAPDRAREALTAVLEAWQAGRSDASLPGTTIRIADSQRSSGQGPRLRSYAILGELPADSGRRFQVKLQLENRAGEQKVQYVVVGIDPLWVIRQEDYDMLTHWDHPMPAAGGAPSQPASASTRGSGTNP